MLFQIGRLLFPDLINSGRAMRFRMILITATLGIALVAATTGVLLKQYRAIDDSSAGVKPLKLK